MRRTISWVGAVGLGGLLAGACGDDADVIDGRALGGRGGAAGSAGGTRPGGSGGTFGNPAGSGGSAGASGASGAAAGTAGAPADADAGLDASAGSAGEPDGGGGVVPPLDAGDAGPPIPCVTAGDCEDDNACTSQACVASFCRFTPVTAGQSCGDATDGECTQPDTCSPNGVCLSNDEPDGTACSGGFCNLAGVCDCAVSRVTSVPYSEQWITIGSSGGGNDTNVYDGTCQECMNDLDHVVVFQAPEAGTYVFSASSTFSAQVWVVESDCTSLGAELGCDDGDIPPDGFDAQLEVTLTQGQIVTMGVSEICEAEGGDGTLSITRSPD
jgi:hypothetical protein